MLRELLNIIRSVDPLREMSENFAEMIRIARKLTIEAGDAFFDSSRQLEACGRIHDEDAQINRLQKRIRSQITEHLSTAGNYPHLPYCLLLIGLVKDVERIGDYAKNLCDVRDICSCDLPADRLLGELREIRLGVDSAFALLARVFEECDTEQAFELIRTGQEFARRCDVLVTDIACSSHNAQTVGAMVLGARYYKRIGGHVLNILSSVVMPLHKVDYYDEQAAVEH